eukprot:TRINITY_DN903_c0_g2_i1.p1 TRINITY_DN903_c0_g2~~TRINITY_DN903_c0_g2_i1.p1  ORF type:complete len:192 (+),score=41.48 TRINITY_DN903_c0_g2_i1:85-576(+)
MSTKFEFDEVRKPEEPTEENCCKKAGFKTSLRLSYAGTALIACSMVATLQFMFSGDEGWEDGAIRALICSCIAYAASTVLAFFCYSTEHHYAAFRKVILSQIAVFIILPILLSLYVYKTQGYTPALMSAGVSGVVSLVAVVVLGATFCVAKHCKHAKEAAPDN